MNADLTCGIVVTYHPTPAHLENLRSLAPQLDEIIVVDNGSSPEALDRLRSIQAELHFILIENVENMGIARALNQGIDRALLDGCEWINLFDQDSRITDGYIREMKEDFATLSERMPLGLLVPRYRNPENEADELSFPTQGGPGPFITITSGSLFPANVLRACGPFAEELFIYVVDDEYSLRLREKGFEIAQSKRAVLMHVCGSPQKLRLFGKTLLTVTNHSPISRYYLYRNRIWLYRRYGKTYPRWFARLGLVAVKEVVAIIVAEDQRGLKLNRMAQGLRDGLLHRTGKARF